MWARRIERRAAIELAHPGRVTGTGDWNSVPHSDAGAKPQRLIQQGALGTLRSRSSDRRTQWPRLNVCNGRNTSTGRLWPLAATQLEIRSWSRGRLPNPACSSSSCSPSVSKSDGGTFSPGAGAGFSFGVSAVGAGRLAAATRRASRQVISITAAPAPLVSGVEYLSTLARGSKAPPLPSVTLASSPSRQRIAHRVRRSATSAWSGAAGCRAAWSKTIRSQIS